MIAIAGKKVPIPFLLIVVGACAPLFFRFFLTLDGPMHVLHACVMKSALWSARYTAPHVDYTVALAAMDPFDAILLPLTMILSPVWAHAAYGVLVLAVLGMGAWSVARACGAANGHLLTWVLPLSFSHIFILGFMTFLLTVGLALFALAWWIRKDRIDGRALLLAGLFALAAQATHRVGASLIVLFMACHELGLFVQERTRWRQRWTAVPVKWRTTLFLAAVGAVAGKVLHTLLTRPHVPVPKNGSSWLGLFDLRPLLLFRAEDERPYLIVLGGLLLITLLLAVRHRWRLRNTKPPGDALLIAAIVLLAAAVLTRTPNAEVLFLGIRAQTVALLLLAIWSAIVVPNSRWTLVLGVAILTTHAVRTLKIERDMAGSRFALDQALAVVDRLPLHGVAMPLVRDDNWTHAHLSAFVAARYEGILFSPEDHLGFRYADGGSPELRAYARGFQHGLTWLERHVVSDAPPTIDHFVLFGHGRPEEGRFKRAMDVCRAHYTLQWKNDYAEVWVRDPLR